LAGWVVTGSGLITAAGDAPRPVLDELARSAGGSRCERPARWPIPGFDIKRYVERKGASQLSRISQLSCAAASRLEPGLAGVPRTSVGVVLGTAWAGLASIVRFEHEAYREGPRFVDPILFTETVANVPAGHVSIAFGWSALNATVAAGAASGLEAVRLALEVLDEGRAEVVVAGGSDATEGHVVDPQGAPAGEAACLLALESIEHARHRGAAVLGRLLGLVVASLDHGDVERAARLARGLLESAGLEPEDLRAVVCCGGPLSLSVARAVLGSRSGAELLAFQDALGQTWGAAGALGLALGMELLRGGTGTVHAGSALVVGDLAGGDFGAALVEAGS
jgi:3-oxoacyl-[acyl-carrier-protein] synthase II